MIECKKCLGTGIIGSGESPWLHLGEQRTCPDCKGTGKIPDPAHPQQSDGAAATPPAPVPPQGFIGKVLANIGL